MARRKRVLTRRNNDEEDHFSKLPEALIVRILSLLNMEDAFKTRLLSKSWKNLWTNVDNILYERFHHDKNDLYHLHNMETQKSVDNRWICFVNHTLMQCKGNIKTFSFNGYADFPAGVLAKWISHVLDKNVEALRLNIKSELPDCLFHSSSITILELVFGKGNTSATVNLSKLEYLMLDHAYADDAFIDRMLMGSPVLENLVIHGKTWIRCLNLMSSRVKVLKLLNIGGEGDAFEIRATWLQELKITGLLTVTNCEVVDVSSLSKATLTFTTLPPTIGYSLKNWVTPAINSWIPMVTKLLKSLSYVGELIIGSHPIQVLSFLRLSGTPSPLFMCKQLTIETYLWKFDIPGIACLIENAPHLETLLIKVLPFSDGLKEAYSFNQTEILFQDGEDPDLNMHYGKFQHLKNFIIDYSKVSCNDDIQNNYDSGFFDFELIEYILKSAVVLEKLVLRSSGWWSCGNNTCQVPNCLYSYVSSLPDMILIIISRTGNKADRWELKKCNNKSEFVFSNYASILSTVEPSSSSM